MELPKLVYDDFYKFLMSFGAILLLASIFVPSVLRTTPLWSITAGVSGMAIMLWAGIKWYENQKILDKKLRAELALIEGHVQKTIRPVNENTVGGAADQDNVALVSYKIASVLPGTISFNFLKDWKVWFLIQNQEKKKYRAYTKVKFISGDRQEEARGDYYGGTKAWNLNALSQIMAPGLEIPDWVKEQARKKQKIEIRILCEVKDENDKLIESKLPGGYVYDYTNNNWYYEP